MLPRLERPASRVASVSRPRDFAIGHELLRCRVFARHRVAWTTIGLLCSTVSCGTAANNATGPGNGGGTGGSHDTGSLIVTMTVPSGVAPNVIVSGPNGYRHALAATQTLSGLAAGSYTIIAATSATSDPIVGVPYSGSVTGSPATVAGTGTATASVTYTKRASAGLLWVSNLLSPFANFTSGALATTGSPAAHGVVNTDGPIAMAIDAAGGVWMSTGFGSDTLVYYTQAQLAGGGTPTPSVRIAPASGLNGATAVALDAQGNLWVAGQYSNTLIELTPAQLTTSGTPTPSVTIKAAFGSIDRPFAIAFDAKGNLWVANINDSTIDAFSPSDLSASGEPVPVAGINAVSGAAATSLAFDSAGNLWAAGYQSVSEFAAKDLTTIGSPAAAVTITLPNGGTTGGLAFDASGDLWVSDATHSQLLRYTPAQLTATGSPTAATVISASGTSLDAPAAIAFSPHAIDLPLH